MRVSLVSFSMNISDWFVPIINLRATLTDRQRLGYMFPFTVSQMMAFYLKQCNWVLLIGWYGIRRPVVSLKSCQLLDKWYWDCFSQCEKWGWKWPLFVLQFVMAIVAYCGRLSCCIVYSFPMKFFKRWVVTYVGLAVSNIYKNCMKKCVLKQTFIITPLPHSQVGIMIIHVF